MYKKLVCIFLWMLLPSFFSYSYAASGEHAVHWREWSPSIFQEAKKEHKLILIYGKVSWCHWCQKMDSSTFPDPRVAELINKNYLPVKIDIERESGLSSHFEINEIPTIIVLNGHNQELKRFTGYNSAQSMMRKLTDVSG